MKEKPILFSTPMVKAIIEDRKIKTRRVIKGMGNKMHFGRLLGDWGLSDPPELIDGVLHWTLQTDVDENEIFKVKCPWEVGQTLWVRETWNCLYMPINNKTEYWYKAGDEFEDSANEKWRPSIFMPRSAARLFLKVTSISVERLQDITQVDAIDEGATRIPSLPEYQKAFNEAIRNKTKPPLGESPRERFIRLWDSLNLKRGYGWDLNPWVWVVEFEKVEKP